MRSVHHVFAERAIGLPFLGLGLSVDVYTPPLPELVQALELHHLPYGYLEIFKAPLPSLQTVRARLDSVPLALHGEGLWIPQPDLQTGYPFELILDETATALDVLDSAWLTLECASKQMGGYAFGTYLPPLFTCTSALQVAQNVCQVQAYLDAAAHRRGTTPPFVLLETPPLTYVACGDVGYADFFRIVTDAAPCGLVLDLGHLWTVYRYTGAWQVRTSHQFFQEFLDRFPVERVLQVHIAGLSEAPSLSQRSRTQAGRVAMWVDAHDAPVPHILWTWLEDVLHHPGFANLKGIALEVDTKPLAVTLEEYAHLRARCRWWESSICSARASVPLHAVPQRSFPAPQREEQSMLKNAALLYEQYRVYGQALITGEPAICPALLDENVTIRDDQETDRAFQEYAHHYLPYEILEWGGAIRQMFPQSVVSLEQAGVDVSAFPAFWFATTEETWDPYDFFLLKIKRFTEFVRERATPVFPVALEEARLLRDAYRAANDLVW
ncbi:MAG: DUF692 family protein [Nitrospirae bacterium]|nr:MAG: DUF692 family protein [Nitrospirota bacterium]